MARALAHIEKVAWIRPIEGADNIELIGVLGWTCIAKKNEFDVNDTCVYFEIDSQVPQTTPFEFMASKHYKVKTMKLGKFNVISQGLALPISAFENESYYNKLALLNIGDDATDIIGVTYSSVDDVARKNDKVAISKSKINNMVQRCSWMKKNKIARWLLRREWGKRFLYFIFGRNQFDKPKAFPSYIVKTDQTRVENRYGQEIQDDAHYIATEKYDGTSTSFGLTKTKGKFDFAVCSRNVRQLDRNQKNYHNNVGTIESNLYWDMADKYNIKEKMEDFFNSQKNIETLVLQGETVGSVQGNPYKLKENQFYAFHLWINGQRCSIEELCGFCELYDIPHVPVLDWDVTLPNTMKEMKDVAEGKSILNPNVLREGIVYYNKSNPSDSFKNVSISYLLKHNG